MNQFDEFHMNNRKRMQIRVWQPHQHGSPEGLG